MAVHKQTADETNCQHRARCGAAITLAFIAIFARDRDLLTVKHQRFECDFQPARLAERTAAATERNAALALGAFGNDHHAILRDVIEGHDRKLVAQLGLLR